MRAVLLGLVGAVLAVGGAGAAECRAGHMTLTQGSKSFAVAAISDVRYTYDGHHGFRQIFRGTMDGRPYIVDMEGIQGNTSSLVSYPGRKPASGGRSPVWGGKPSGWKNGDTTMILAGPMNGDWRAICR